MNEEGAIGRIGLRWMHNPTAFIASDRNFGRMCVD